jgi:hypothetical protein
MIGKIPVFIAVIHGTAAGAIQFYMEIQPEQILMRVTSNILDSRRIMLWLCAHRSPCLPIRRGWFFQLSERISYIRGGTGHFTTGTSSKTKNQNYVAAEFMGFINYVTFKS